MGKVEPEDKKLPGCGLVCSLFCRRRNCPPRRPPTANAASQGLPFGSPDEAMQLVPVPTFQPEPALTAKPPLNPSKAGASPPVRATKRPPGTSGAARAQAHDNGVAAELEDMIYDHQRAKGSGCSLVRASSSNVMLFGPLGNLRGKGSNGVDCLTATAKETGPKAANARCGNGNAGQASAEELKEMGNEEYKKGRFAEAVALYDEAIMLEPDKACYRSNKAAALIGLGRLLEAVSECQEAVRIEPSYGRAHHRLATLYHRLGEAGKAIHHYKQSQTEANKEEISQVQALQLHLTKCNEARKLNDWQTMLQEALAAVSAGADSAPQIFASQAEALLKLQRPVEADAAISGTPKFDVDVSTKFFGATGNAHFLVVQAQVDMAAGRFDEANAAAKKAVQLDPSNKHTSAVAQKASVVAAARSKGNDLFKASKFEEALTAYGEGLDHDSYNAILLCNRAACRSKLGQWEKAVQDCSTSLNVRSSYSKARLRRADCNAKLERWEASIQDYEVLMRELPGDQEVAKALNEARAQLKIPN